MMRSLRRSAVAVLQGIAPVAIEGDETHGTTAVRVRDASGRELRFETDAVALVWHLRAESAAGRSCALRIHLPAAELASNGCRLSMPTAAAA